MFTRFHRIHERDGQTDRQTDGRTDGQTPQTARRHGPRLYTASRGKMNSPTSSVIESLQSSFQFVDDWQL